MSEKFRNKSEKLFRFPANIIFRRIIRIFVSPGGASAPTSWLQKLNRINQVKALRLTEVVLAQSPDNKSALEVRLAALRALSAKSENWIESNWLNAEIKDISAKLAPKPE